MITTMEFAHNIGLGSLMWVICASEDAVKCEWMHLCSMNQTNLSIHHPAFTAALTAWRRTSCLEAGSALVMAVPIRGRWLLVLKVNRLCFIFYPMNQNNWSVYRPVFTVALTAWRRTSCLQAGSMLVMAVPVRGRWLLVLKVNRLCFFYPMNQNK